MISISYNHYYSLIINSSNNLCNLWLTGLLTWFETILCDTHQYQQDGKTVFITQPPGEATVGHQRNIM